MTASNPAVRRRFTVSGIGLALRTFLPPVRSVRFWIVQAGVLSVALLHDVVLAGTPGAGHAFGVPDAMTSAFLLIPVIYAALNFGVRGSIATSVWATALIAPHWWLMDDLAASHLVIEVGNLAVLYVVAIVVGQRVECEQRARRRAEAALAAAVAEQQRREEEQRAFSGRLLAVQEEERRKLAQELHDDPLQNLMYLTRALDDLSDDPELPRRLIPALRYGGELAGEAATALRKTIHGLRPPVLDDIGITSALRQLVADVAKRSTLTVTLRCAGTEHGLAPELKLAAYRIVQESLNNVVRHARASRAAVTIRFGDPLTLTISDDGKGIPPPSPRSADAPQPGLGLIGMRERATLAGGTLRVSTRHPHGTVVEATLPPVPAQAQVAGDCEYLDESHRSA
ncbi:MAG: sensor histidine kinase [Micromonosporaceae bacterium]